MMKFEGPTAVIGIDIGASSLKAALIVRDTNGVTCKGFLVHPLSEAEDQSEEILVGLSNVAMKFKSVTTNVALVTSKREVMLKFVEKPQMPPEALRRVMENDFKASSSADAATANLYTVLGETSTEAGTTQHILTATFPVPFVHERLAMFKKAGLKLIGIFPFALAIRDIFWLNYEEEVEEHDSPYLIAFLNFGDTTNQVVVCDKNVLRLARAFPFAGRELTKTLAKEYEKDGQIISLDQSNAEVYKTTVGILNDQEEMGYDPGALEIQVSQMIRRGMDRMTQKLRLSLDYFKGQMKAQMAKAFIFGGGSNMRGLPEVLADKLAVADVHELSPFINMALAPAEAEDMDPPPEQRNMIVLAIGAGLSAMLPPAQTMNLLSAVHIDWAKEIKKLVQNLLLPGLAFLGILLVPALYWLQVYRPDTTALAALQAENARLQGEFTPVQKYKKIYDDLLKEERNLNIRSSFINSIMSKRVFWSKKLWDLAKLMPDEVWVTELTTAEFLSDGDSGGGGDAGGGGGGAPPGAGGGPPGSSKKSTSSSLKLQMKGQSSSYAAFSQFLKDLEKSPSFTGVKWEESKRDQNSRVERINFSVTFSIRPPRKKATKRRKKSS